MRFLNLLNADQTFEVSNEKEKVNQEEVIVCFYLHLKISKSVFSAQKFPHGKTCGNLLSIRLLLFDYLK